MIRKKTKQITSLGKKDKLLVQKSLQLFALGQSEFTLEELKILDTYLARINSRDPDRRTVVFGKEELEKVLEGKKINLKELKERLEHLKENAVKIPDADEKKGFASLRLFRIAEAYHDDYGLCQIKLECTKQAMKYIFNIEKTGYLRYKLQCITPIKSRYTYILFIYIEHNRYRESWEVPLNELKKILNCNAERYKEFKYFNSEVLARVQKEMHEKTECRYKYEPLKKGRSVIAVRFTVKKREKEISKEFWVEALKRNGVCEFSDEQLLEIREVLYMVPSKKLPKKYTLRRDSMDFRRYRYMKSLYETFCCIAIDYEKDQRFWRFLKMIASDV